MDMHRRTMLLSLIAGPGMLAPDQPTQEPPAPDPSLYIPKAHLVEDRSSDSYDFSKLPDSYVTGLMKGIAPFEMEIEALEGKFKLGQERPARDKQGVLAHLQKTAYHERSLYDVTEAFYRTVPR